MKKVNGLLSRVLNKRELELETFDLIDVSAPNYDELVDEYRSKAASLEIDVSNRIIPFPNLSKAEIHTWETYCPQKTDLKEYKQVIPIEVIRLAEEIKKRNYFYKIQVWEENKEEVDPVMIGVFKGDYSSPLYLLARWGAALKPYEVIRDIAKKMWKENKTARLNEEIKKAQRQLEDMDENCVKYFNGEWLPF